MAAEAATPAVEFSADEIEAGRRLFAGDWRFTAAAASIAILPANAGPELAFAGRSNVGKSSLINALTGRRALARTSRTPGRTQELLLFSSDRGVTLVDMPGYGFAAASKANIARWTALIAHYLRQRSNLIRVYVLIDARHGLKPIDAPLLDILDGAAVSYQVVLTKVDQLPPAGVGPQAARVQAELRRRPAAFPELAITSARSGIGIVELRAAVVRVLTEPKWADPAASS
jgi:GTP-binding protein